MNAFNIKCFECLLPSELKDKFLSYNVTRLTLPGENYGSLILKVDVTIKHNDKEETVHMVAKCIPANKALQEIFNIKVTFRNEIAWYTDIIPLFQNFRRESAITDGVLECFPKLYGSRLNLVPESTIVDEDGVLLMENLAAQGFKTQSRFEGFDLDTAMAALKVLAHFHATGMALKVRNPKVFYEKVMPYIVHKKKDPENFSSSIISFLEKEKPEFCAFIGRVKNAVLCTFGSNKTSSDDVWKTALHNDFWINNILIKKHRDGKTNLAILDFQIATYGSIASELLFFLVTSVNNLTATDNMDRLIEFYFTQLCASLNTLGIVERRSIEDFKEELKLQGPSAFARAVFALLIVLNEKGKSFDTTSEDFDPDGFVEILKENLTDRQKEKCCFLVEEFVSRDWI